ncbi:MAG: hypothetical protein A2X34_07365 [Elusimicrobia bacterium GWC2_51_8]|nr:MAG: hypothetical protein A2X33_00535 [Elusimicrobia bacterium GWA2_51_34]OGR58738.1 MAG: hypothetical protein A2X34_07365 [Elusimicrobia bacterium GWC2_51_8]OGR87626.1 MAG: hypothetical protein A2021_09230 [Elusimicrobia bacterium GWF2_52_66]HAF96357.1 hypothetical protein [Elusimicrobiota bacterium]HCE98543.1 hypothetical protein [Elusimicrobiota bacterium]
MVCFAVAAVVGGAWIFHITESAHNPADNDCQICAVFGSLEVSPSGDYESLIHPDNCSRINLICRLPFAKRIAVFICSSRAPPFSA